MTSANGVSQAAVWISRAARAPSSIFVCQSRARRADRHTREYTRARTRTRNNTLRRETERGDLVKHSEMYLFPLCEICEFSCMFLCDFQNSKSNKLTIITIKYFMGLSCLFSNKKTRKLPPKRKSFPTTMNDCPRIISNQNRALKIKHTIGDNLKYLEECSVRKPASYLLPWPLIGQEEAFPW